MTTETNTKQFFKTHEWIVDLGDGKYRMGVSQYACDQLGDIVFVEEQDAGSTIDEGSSLAILESVKAVGDIYAPVDAEIVATNPAAVAEPESISGETWIVEIKTSNSLTNLDLLPEAAYQDYLQTL